MLAKEATAAIISSVTPSLPSTEERQGSRREASDDKLNPWREAFDRAGVNLSPTALPSFYETAPLHETARACCLRLRTKASAMLEHEVEKRIDANITAH
jgi:hypothetical protein